MSGSSSVTGLGVSSTQGVVVSGPTPGNSLTVVNGATGVAAALVASGSDTNIGAALVPKGTGALTGAIPDSTVAGGNTRGANAVDWQRVRSTLNMVASGVSSVIGGGSNNTAGGTHSVIAGGNTNAVNSGAGWVPGGQQASTRGINSAAWSAGRFTANNGTAQKLEHILRASTTDATPIRLCGDVGTGIATTSNSVPLVDGSSYNSRIEVIARDQAASVSASWVLNVLVDRATGVASVVLTGGGAAIAPTQSTGAGSTWRLAVAADTTLGSIAITGTGAAATTIRWVASVVTTEVGSG